MEEDCEVNNAAASKVMPLRVMLLSLSITEGDWLKQCGQF